MKLLFLSFLLSAFYSFSQVNIYDPKANAAEDLKKAVSEAKEQNKHVIVQIGGNWCPWCVKLHAFMNEDKQIDSVIKADYVLVKVNYSSEEKNEEILKELGYPQRFGFPVLVVLDDDGTRLHTQNSWYLEEGKSYDKKKVLAFLANWNSEALKPEKYK